MKLVVISVVFTLVLHYSKQQAPLDAEKIEAITDDCIKETKVDPALPLKLFQTATLTDDKNLKCFVKCMFVKLGDMSESGEVNLNNLKLHAPPELTTTEIAAITERCKDQTGADPCEKAFNIAKCLIGETMKRN